MAYLRTILISSALATLIGATAVPALAQSGGAGAASGTQQAAAAQAPQPLTDEELEVLVARIALYPDELVALVAAASLYPLQIIEADRFLVQLKADKSLKPKPDWDGSVISLLNYPDVVRMMSEDLDWTEAMGTAIVNQEDDVLAAIQQLRERAVAEQVIKSDDKLKVVEENDTIVIQPASSEVIYIPQYAPEMLYEPGYPYEPVTYYPEAYPYYYSPGAAFFAGAVTGAIWSAVIDWDDGFWGGDWDWGDGGDVDFDFDCNKCIIGNDFSGKLNIRDADWTNIDRSKIKMDKAAFSKLDRANMKNRIESGGGNRLRDKGGEIGGGNRVSALPAKGGKPVKDVRASTLEGLKKQPGPKPGTSNRMAEPGKAKVADRAGQGPKKPQAGQRPSGPKKAGAKVDIRPRNPPPVGDMSRGSSAKKYSQRGHQSIGASNKRPSAGGGRSVKRPPIQRSGGGGRGGGRRR